MHEIHRPGLIDRRGYRKWQWLLTYKTLARFDAQVQLQLAIDTVDALVVPFEAFHVAQVKKAQAEAPVALIVRQTHQPVGD